MTPNQEEALYDFLENVTEPFTLRDVTAFIHILEPQRDNRLPMEIAAMIDSRNIAFRVGNDKWVSRRGCFEQASFVIDPSRLELLNGVLIPGHRCVPFANPALLPHEYQFFWKGALVPATTSEGPPADFYPYYCIYGEEYAPQFIARENPENEAAFNIDPFEDPPEVSIQTLDMRSIYREAAFVPGDHFVVRTLDWKKGHFALEKVPKDAWPQNELYGWFEAAESGFEDSFSLLGPGPSTEEQIAYAFWYGGKRMREVPAYSLEDFLFEKTDRIETVPYGIESRFWFAGKEIADSHGLKGFSMPPDRTVIEDLLEKNGIPISEYVVLSYVRDALFRSEDDINNVAVRIIPPVIQLKQNEYKLFFDYLAEAMALQKRHYSIFTDQGMGPIRQRAGELHTGVITLSYQLTKGEIDPACLPKHTFIILSQIQGHVASLLEDLDVNEMLQNDELDSMDNSLDSMIDTYKDIKELIDDAFVTYRKNNFSIYRGGASESAGNAWWEIQISVSGAEAWRRFLVPETYTLEELHRLIQIGLNWQDSTLHQFSCKSTTKPERKRLSDEIELGELCDAGVRELLYEYGTKWTVKVIFLSSYQPENIETIRCVAGNGAAPPEDVAGPLRFRRVLGLLEGGNDAEKKSAQEELGPDFIPGRFDMEKCNQNLKAVHLAVKEKGDE